VVVLIALWGGAAAALDAATQAPSPPASADTTAQPPMTDIHDIKPLVAVDTPFPAAAVALIGAAGLALLGLALYYLKRRAGQRTSPLPPPLPPETAALAQLDAIRDLAVMEARKFYFQLSAVLRTYLHGRYGLNAPEMTTEEILPRIGTLGLPADLAARLEALLLSADPIKFAALPASRRKMETDLGFAYAFVEKTTPPSGETLEADELKAQS
jgi:hypothetical protein